MYRIFFYIFALFLAVVPSFIPLEGRPSELARQELPKEIQEMLKQHATVKKLSPEVVQRVLTNYLALLDPTKSYFIEPEIHEWIVPSSTMLSKVQNELTQGNIDEFLKIQAAFVQAIQRKRAIDASIDNDHLPKGVEAKEFKDLSWVKGEKELKERIERIRALQVETAAKLNKELQKNALLRIEKRQIKLEDDAETADPKKKERFILTRILKAVASSLDPHTVYFTPDEAKEFLINVEQRLFGIGAQLRDDLNGLTVTKIVDGGPASKSGLVKVGDRIIAVDHEPVVGMDIIDAVSLIRGKESTPVVLTVMRKKGASSEEEQLEVSLQRGEVVLKESRFDAKREPYGHGIIGYLHLHSFYQDPEFSSAGDMAKAIQEMADSKGLMGLILDLRYNSGGLLTQAVDVAGLFLDKGVVVSIKDEEGHIQHLRNLESDKIWGGPLIVLINRASASASEIVAKTLQDWGRALIVGDDHSFGKGTFQTFSLNPAAPEVDPKGETKVTRGMYHTVSGKSPQLEGVKPDIIVKGVLSESEIGEQFAKYPLQPQEIPPSFEDDLGDIPFFQRAQAKLVLAQFPRQKKESGYLTSLPLLEKNSKERVENNKPYQKFLSSLKKGAAEEEEIEEGDQVDFQLNETINIMRDLLFLQKK